MSSFSVTGLLSRYASRLSGGALLGITVALFAISVIVPDPLPFIDEILLGLAALMLSRRKRRTVDDEAPTADPTVVAEQDPSGRSKSTVG